MNQNTKKRSEGGTIVSAYALDAVDDHLITLKSLGESSLRLGVFEDPSLDGFVFGGSGHKSVRVCRYDLRPFFDPRRKVLTGCGFKIAGK